MRKGKLPIASDRVAFVDETGQEKVLERRRGAVVPGARVLAVEEWQSKSGAHQPDEPPVATGQQRPCWAARQTQQRPGDGRRGAEMEEGRYQPPLRQGSSVLQM